MTFALARHCAAFDATFYAAAATVIPVLFIAIVLQSDTIASLLRLIERDALIPARRERSAVEEAGSTAFVLAMFVLLGGVAGEILALVSLAWDRAILGDFWVLAAAIFLTLVAALPLITSVGRSIVTTNRHYRYLLARQRVSGIVVPHPELAHHNRQGRRRKRASRRTKLADGQR